MYSLHIVKQQICDQLAARPGMSRVSILYGPGTQREDFEGRDDSFDSMFTFNDVDGSVDVTNMCGPGRVEFDEEYTIGAVIQVIGRNTDAWFPEVNRQRAEIYYQLTRVLQDPSLGHPTTAVHPDDATRVSQLVVSVGAHDIPPDGLLNKGGTDQAACRMELELAVTARINPA